MVKWEKIDSNKISLEIEVPKEEVNEALEKAYYKLRGRFVIPGFRKGKAPRKIIESRYGAEVFNEEVLEMLADPAYRDAIKETKQEPISQPEVEMVQLEKDKPLILKVNVEVKPEFELGEYKGVTIEQVKKEITDEDVDKYIDALREQHARLVAVEDGELQEKDMAVVDFSGTVEGEPFQGSEAENYSLQIGSKTFIEGFEEQLVGATRGEKRDVKVTFPPDYYREELAGKEAVFNVEIKEIKRPQLPPMDDSFVQELTEDISTVEEFRADVEKRLTEDLERRQKVDLESRLIEKVAEGCEVDVPVSLVNREIENLLGEFEYYLRTQGINLDQYAEMIEGGKERLIEERRGEAEKRARANLVLDAIIKVEEIEATKEEIDKRIRELMERFKVEGELDEARMKFSADGRLDMIKHEIRYRKAVDLLVENARIEEMTPEEAEEKALKTVAPNQNETAEASEHKSDVDPDAGDEIPKESS